MTPEELARFEEHCLSSELTFDGKVLHVYVDRIALPDGEKTGFREYIRHMGAVAVLPLDASGNVYCVRQYRYAVGKVMTEIPAGKLDTPDEDPLSAALRELREETGAVAGRVTYLGVYLGSPAILDEKIHLFLAEDLSFGETDFDDDENLETLRMPLSKLVTLVLSGEIEDGKTQVAALRAAILRGLLPNT